MKVLEVMNSRPTQDGDGVKIARVADFKTHGKLDPFLMIDELKSDDVADYMGGFPPHPHRGIETFTYILKGGFEHQDQMGHQKVIGAGDVQWMSTGYGVMHSEMPLADANEGMHGFQIWLNMAAKDKLRPAQYQDSTASGLPVISTEQGAQLKALAGHWQLAGQTIQSELNQLSANGAIADVMLPAGTRLDFETSGYDQLLIYIHSGSLSAYRAGQLLILDPDAPVQLKAPDIGTGALILAGNKLKEPVAHMGPFVMNHEAELKQAVLDYQAGKFGSL